MNLYEYEINNKGIIYIDKNKFLHFTFSTAILMDIIDKFFKKVKEINNYIDVGTQEEWDNYKKSFKTLFLDIDGTIFFNSGEYSSISWGDNEPIQENVDYIRKIYGEGRTKIILTTARKLEYKNKTIEQLKKYNIPYDDIIFNLYHSKRYLINDFSESNPYPTSIAINIKRNDNNLKNFFHN